ncbi:MAG: CoB--CoM heterodisulfide reductase iron-sulfur subunit B family protein [Syntrophorhabdaceae bacterium]|nr:CoB--CoM heterodisulfide reductase iron-sulfur subunit B family protein [Syntrophorhabdaceae bacterium]
MIALSYYPGCSLASSSSFYDRSLRKVLAYYGVALNELDDWSCCGAAAAPTIHQDLTDVLAARNIALAEREGLHLLAPCSACYARSKAASLKIAGDRATRDMVNQALAPLSCTGSVEVKNVIEVFLQYVGVERIAASAAHKLGPIRAVSYYGCLLTRIMGVPSSDDTEDPTGMDVILDALGAVVVPWQYKTECCGAGSTITNSERTAELSGRIMTMAVRAGANAIVTTCPLCQLNLDLVIHLKKNAATLPVFFLTEIFELALFGAVEGGGRHLIPADDIERSIGAPGGDHQ